MADLKLTSYGDVYIDPDTNSWVIIDGLEAIRQSLTQAFNFVKGESKFAPDDGMPYFEKILGQKPRLNVVRKFFKDMALKVDGVERIQNMSLSFDGTTRTLSVSFHCVAVDGTFLYQNGLQI